MQIHISSYHSDMKFVWLL